MCATKYEQARDCSRISQDKFSAREREKVRGIGCEKPGGLVTRSLRGGAVRSSRETGGSFAQLLKGGRWRSTAYRLFLDLGAEEAAAMAPMLIEASDDEAQPR